MSAFSGDAKPNVKSNSILTLDAKTSIIDSPTEDQEDIFAFNLSEKKVLIYDVLQAIKNAKTDHKIKGISIESDFIRSGFTQLDDIRAALEDFKKSGKFVYAYGNNVTQSSYYLGSVADQYYLHPAGGIELKGLAAEVMFFKDFTEKYGINTQVIRHGKYKSAVEPFLRNDISPENEQQLSTLLNDIWKGTAQKIYTSRKIDSAQFNTIVDSLYAIIPNQSLHYKLVDKLIQKSEYDDIIKTKIKWDKNDDLNRISFSKYIKSYKDRSEQKNHVAVLYASGAIYDGEGYNEIYADNYVEEIQELAKDDKVKAVVLRINSPGGSANASDQILFELKKLKAKKPVIVSFGDYAASGGYYVAMAADKIYSEPNTITGSIGVFGVITSFGDLANKNGINSDIVETNENSMYYSPLKGVSPGGISIITKSVEQTYKRFVHFVTQNRKKTFEQIDEVGGGRVWSGTRAKQIGLVDELGTLEDAIAFAAKKAKMSEDYKVTAYPKTMSQFEQIFTNLEEDELSTRILEKKIGKENFKIFKEFTKMKEHDGVMMKMPFLIKIQ